MFAIRHLPIKRPFFCQSPDQPEPFVRAVQIVELSGDRAEVGVNALEDFLRCDWSIIHVPPFNLIPVMRPEVVVEEFIVARWCVPLERKEFKLAAESFGFFWS